jgi:hypothetical protein
MYGIVKAILSKLSSPSSVTAKQKSNLDLFLQLLSQTHTSSYFSYFIQQSNRGRVVVAVMLLVVFYTGLSNPFEVLLVELFCCARVFFEYLAFQR